MNRIADQNSNLTLTIGGIFRFCLGAFIIYIGLLILTPFPHYLPPNFARGFLTNKADFFYSSGYFVGFYAHILTAPLGLLLGTMQMCKRLRRSYPIWHMRVGRVYVALVLLGVAPGGFIMGLRAYGGMSGVLCFCALSVCMWFATFRAWRLAVLGRFHEHGQWMFRSYLLMCSAILLRLISFVLSQFELGHEFSYQLAAWLSWLPGLVLLEIWFKQPQSKPSYTAS